MPRRKITTDETTLTAETLANLYARKACVEVRMASIDAEEEALKAEEKTFPQSLRREGRRLAREAREIDELLVRHVLITIDAAAAADIAAGADPRF